MMLRCLVLLVRVGRSLRRIGNEDSDSGSRKMADRMLIMNKDVLKTSFELGIDWSADLEPLFMLSQAPC